MYATVKELTRCFYFHQDGLLIPPTMNKSICQDPFIYKYITCKMAVLTILGHWDTL